MRREIANTHPVVIVCEGGSSIFMIEPRSHGVLDTRLRGYDSLGWAALHRAKFDQNQRWRRWLIAS
jgi:hypothetical protein